MARAHWFRLDAGIIHERLSAFKKTQGYQGRQLLPMVTSRIEYDPVQQAFKTHMPELLRVGRENDILATPLFDLQRAEEPGLCARKVRNRRREKDIHEGI
jgi:hypothetical protein